MYNRLADTKSLFSKYQYREDCFPSYLFLENSEGNEPLNEMK